MAIPRLLRKAHAAPRRVRNGPRSGWAGPVDLRKQRTPRGQAGTSRGV